MLEVITEPLDAHHDAEAALADPSRGPNLATTRILADPTGVLERLRRTVAAEYGRGRWVLARCEAEKADARAHLAAMRQARDPGTRAESVWLFLNALSGLLAVARLRRPTTRRTLTLLRDLLAEAGRPDLHEASLELFGSAAMSREEVRNALDESVAAFDRSVEVYHTPTPYGFTIRAHLRPYLAEGAREMIDEGSHREAVFWIAALAGESYLVLQNDAPEVEKPRYAARRAALHAALGYDSPVTWNGRVAAAGRLMRRIFPIADAFAARHPD
jgi:hypothetical protein